MAPVQIPGVNVAFLTGPNVIGYMLGSLLQGVLIVQVYNYYNTFPKDRRSIKLLVAFVFTLECIYTLFTLIGGWLSYGPGWGDVDTLAAGDWSWIPLPLLSGITEMTVQLFFCYRIYKILKNRWIPAIIGALAVLQCALVAYIGIENTIRGRRYKDLIFITDIMTAWLVSSALCDVLIAICTVSGLVRAHKHSHFKNTTNTLKRLIKFTVETGLITASSAIIELILWLTMNQWNFHYIIFLIIAKLYSNTMVASLNSRVPPKRMDGEMFSQATAVWEDELSTNNTFLNTRLQISRTTDVVQDDAHDMVIISKNYGENSMVPRKGDP